MQVYYKLFSCGQLQNSANNKSRLFNLIFVLYIALASNNKNHC